MRNGPGGTFDYFHSGRIILVHFIPQAIAADELRFLVITPNILVYLFLQLISTGKLHFPALLVGSLLCLIFRVFLDRTHKARHDVFELVLGAGDLEGSVNG